MRICANIYPNWFAKMTRKCIAKTLKNDLASAISRSIFFLFLSKMQWQKNLFLKILFWKYYIHLRLHFKLHSIHFQVQNHQNSWYLYRYLSVWYNKKSYSSKLSKRKQNTFFIDRESTEEVFSRVFIHPFEFLPTPLLEIFSFFLIWYYRSKEAMNGIGADQMNIRIVFDDPNSIYCFF